MLRGRRLPASKTPQMSAMTFLGEMAPNGLLRSITELQEEPGNVIIAQLVLPRPYWDLPDYRAARLDLGACSSRCIRRFIGRGTSARAFLGVLVQDVHGKLEKI